jgi:hypothetical protein
MATRAQAVISQTLITNFAEFSVGQFSHFATVGTWCQASTIRTQTVFTYEKLISAFSTCVFGHTLLYIIVVESQIESPGVPGLLMVPE